MSRQDFQRHGPNEPRVRNARGLAPMATPVRQDLYSSDTLSLRGFARRSPPRKTGSAWWLVPTLLIIAALATVLGGLTYLDQRYAGKIYPNVSIQGTDLTEMTAAQAAQALHQRFDTFLGAPVRFQYAGRSWEPAAEEIGLKVNIEAQVAEALRAGRGNGVVDDISEVATIWQQGLDLPLHMTIDGRKLQQYLVRAAGEVEQPAREATLVVDTTRGTAQATESAEGRMLLLDETIAEAIEGLHTLEQQQVVIRTRTLEPGLATKDVAEAKRTVDAMLQAPMELRFTQENQTFPLSQTDIADMITIRRTIDGQRPVLNAQLDQDKLRKWATKLADEVGRESVEPRVAWNGGNLQIMHEGRTAYRLDIERTMEVINGAILGAKRSVDLPVNEDQPEATPENLANLGIKELIASGKSDFTGSAEYRITNIKAGMNLINGILVPPDEEFSFNENVGAIDAEHGFAEGYSIIGNRTQKDPGGGICQVSTTLFRAAFYSGLPFTDWTPHRFRISWYEKYDSIGMDSTIYTGGGPDLRFKNDTDHWILIEGVVDEGQKMVTFNIYGTQVPGRTVEKIGPEISNETPAPKEPVYIDDPEQPVGVAKQTDTARGGLEVEIWRVIKQDGAEVRRARFLTQFQPWPNIFLKNPKTPLPPGAKLGTG